MAERVQLRRTKGYRKPEGAVVVARPTRWGNPITPAVMGDKAAAAEWFGVGLDLRRSLKLPPNNVFWRYPTDDEIRVKLRGKDLACWCPLVDDEGNHVPCHADVLLEVANA